MLKMENDFLHPIKRNADEESDTSSEIGIPRAPKTRPVVYSSEGEETVIDEEWLPPNGNQPQVVPFAPGPRVVNTGRHKEEEFFLLFVTEDLLQEIADQTNVYAARLLQLRNQPDPFCRWVPTSKEEIKKLFGLIIWMGVLVIPEVGLYWTRDPLFAVSLPRSVMSRNRFELLLRMIHFTGREDIRREERLSKIKTVVDTLNENFGRHHDPPENVRVDDTAIHLRGRLRFRKCVKSKKQKYDFCVFKLCSGKGYTHRFLVHDAGSGDAAPASIVLALSQDIVEKGHTIYVDSRYTSLELAVELVGKDTHLVGTIRPNRPGLDREVIGKNLKRGDVFGKEHLTGITLMKWRDKRDWLALSTKHSVDMVGVRVKGRRHVKPALIADYNANIGAVPDPSHYTPLTVKWYLRLAFELLLNTAVVNAWVLYNERNRTSISLLQYKRKLISYLCNVDEGIDEDVEPGKFHELKKGSGSPAKRSRCRSCYAKAVETFNTETARRTTKRVTTYCDDCPNKPFLCIPCFNEVHRSINKPADGCCVPVPTAFGQMIYPFSTMTPHYTKSV